MRIGKAHIDIVVRGCYGCGTEHSSGWHLAETVSVRIGDRKPVVVNVNRCESCHQEFKNEAKGR